MNKLEAIKKRHSVRSYTDEAISAEEKRMLKIEIDACNREAGLHIQLILNEPDAFSGTMAKYGKFQAVNNYIAMIGKKGSELEEKIGYFGERIVIRAQQIGLNTCWVAMTYDKRMKKYDMNPGERLVCVIAVGHGSEQGEEHKSKPIERLCNYCKPMPEWFRKGMESAMLAPTAINQQRFLIIYEKGEVSAVAAGGMYSKLDLGIVKYHFEIGAAERIEWTIRK